MGKFLLGVLTGFALVFLGFVFLFFVVVMLGLRARAPEVASNSVLVLRLDGALPEKPGVEVPFLSDERGAITVSSLWSALARAAGDPRIRAVVIEPENLGAGWAKIEEVRSDLEAFRRSGKPVYAYLRAPGTREYYIALAADRIYLGPEDPLMVKGLRAELMYFKNTLDKIGVTVDVQHAGKYKDFGDMFTRTDMSPETREVIGGLVDNLYGNMVGHIASARHKTPDEVRALIDDGPFTAPQALAAHLVDSLSFEDQMWGDLKNQLHLTPQRLPIEKYLKAYSPANTGARSHISLVIGEGDIVHGDPDDDGAGEGELGSYGFIKLLRQAGADYTSKGVIVRIDSPGGEVSASDEIWREMQLLSQKKPVVISMSDVAASGGYYMALTGGTIVAYPQTETGSIGVVFGKPDLRGLYDKLGISKPSIERGRNAGIDSDYTELTPDQREKLQAGIDESYRAFVEKVAQSRRRTFDQIDAVAQGRVWLGSDAQAHGLVDELGGLDTAVAALKRKAGMAASEQVDIVTYPARRRLLDILMRRSSEDMLAGRLRQIFGHVPYHAWLAGGMLRIMPAWVEVH